MLLFYFFLQESNQFLQAPVTLGSPLDMQVARHLSPIPHLPHIAVQGMHTCFDAAPWAAAGIAAQTSRPMANSADFICPPPIVCFCGRI